MAGRQNLSWIGDVLRDVREYCSQNDLPNLEKHLGDALGIYEREAASTKGDNSIQTLEPLRRDRDSAPAREIS